MAHLLGTWNKGGELARASILLERGSELVDLLSHQVTLGNALFHRFSRRIHGLDLPLCLGTVINRAQGNTLLMLGRLSRIEVRLVRTVYGLLSVDYLVRVREDVHLLIVVNNHRQQCRL